MKSLMLMVSLPLVALLALGPLMIERAHSAESVEVITQVSRDNLLGVMQAEGYAVSTDTDGDIVWKIEGLRSLVLVADDGESVQFVAAFSDGNATLEKVNLWNRSKRFSRTYLDANGDPVLELDLDLAGGVTPARVLDFFKTCKASFGPWVDEVVK